MVPSLPHTHTVKQMITCCLRNVTNDEALIMNKPLVQRN